MVVQKLLKKYKKYTMNNNQLGIFAILAASLYYFSQSNTNSGENYYNIPGVGDVPESKLASMGYVKYNGLWFKYSDVLAAAQANGIPPGATQNIDISTQQGMDIFMTLLAAGTNIATTIINNTQAQKNNLIEQIITKYTLTVSASYDDDFPYTEAQLQSMTIVKLNKILSGDFTVTGIRNDPGGVFLTQCRDRKYTDKNGRGACSHHKGVSQRAGRAGTSNGNGNSNGKSQRGQRIGWTARL